MNVVTSLEQLGLSPKQAEIYLFLVENPGARIQEISRGADMPRSSVYQNLRGLSQIGLVEEIVDHGISRFKSFPTSVLIHEWEAKIAQAGEIEKTLADVTKQTKTAEVRYYKGVAGARQLFWNTLKAKSEVLVYSEFGRSKYVGRKFYRDFVEESARRRIKEKVIINPTSEALALIKRDTGTELARTRPQDIRYMDKKQMDINGETFIYDKVYAVVFLKNRMISGWEIESRDFASMQRAIFRMVWKTARSMAELD